MLISNLLHCFQVTPNQGNFSVFDQTRDLNSGKMEGYLACGQKLSLSPKQSLELVIRNAALLFLPTWPHPTKELSGQGSCWRNKAKTSHSRKMNFTLVLQAFGDDY